MLNLNSPAPPTQPTKPPINSIEVKSNIDSLKGAWYTATIISSSTSSKTQKTLIRYQTLLSEDGLSPLTEYVFPSQIRPLPPYDDSQCVFNRNDVVDAWYRNGWWTGTVKQILPGLKKYFVFVDGLVDVMEFDRADLRTHLDWVFDEWVRPPRNLDAQLPSEKSNDLGRELGEVIESSIVSLRGLFPRLAGSKKRDSKDVVSDQTSANKESFSAKKIVKTKQKDVTELLKDTVTMKRPTTSPYRSSRISELAKESDNIDASVEHIIPDRCKEQATEFHVVMGLQAKEKRKLLPDSTSELKDKGSFDIVRKSNLAGVENTVTGRRGKKRARESEARSPKTMEIALQDAHGDGTVEAPECTLMQKSEVDVPLALASKNAPEDDLLSTKLLGGLLRDKKSADGMSELNIKADETILTMNDEKTEDVLYGDAFLFKRKSPLWKTIESLDVLKKLPQKPHFSPLAATKEEYREGSAIGIMVTYISLFEKISSLRFDDSRSIFESSLDSLQYLEKHGFAVSMLRARVSELMRIKDGEGEVMDELQESEKQIETYFDEKRKLDVEVRDIKKKMSELVEELAKSELKMESVNQNLSRMQSMVDSTRGRLEIARKDFDKVAASPLEFSEPVV